jgi:hypothetical protein
MAGTRRRSGASNRWFQRAGVVLLVAVLLLGSTLAASSRPCGAASLTNLPDDLLRHWARADVQRMLARGLMVPAADGLFHPDAAATRLDVVAALVYARGYRAQCQGWPITMPPCFGDVPPLDPAFGALGIAYDLGITRGYGDGTFRPGNAVSRAEAAVLIACGLHLSALDAPPAGAAFVDRDVVPAWARGYVWAMANAGALRSYEDGTFRPGAPVPRGELAHMLTRLLEQRGLLWDACGEVTATPQSGWLELALPGGGALRIPLAAAALVTRNGSPAAPSGLGPRDQVQVMLTPGGAAVLVEAWWDDDTGYLLKVDAPGRRLTVHAASGMVTTVALTPDARVYRFGVAVGLGALVPGDRLYLVYDHFTGRVRCVDAVGVEFSGVIVGARAGQSSMELMLPGGEVRRFTVWAGTTVFIDGARASPDALRPGDRVVAMATSGGVLARYIEVVRSFGEDVFYEPQPGT